MWLKVWHKIMNDNKLLLKQKLSNPNKRFETIICVLIWSNLYEIGKMWHTDTFNDRDMSPFESPPTCWPIIADRCIKLKCFWRFSLSILKNKFGPQITQINRKCSQQNELHEMWMARIFLGPLWLLRKKSVA